MIKQELNYEVLNYQDSTHQFHVICKDHTFWLSHYQLEYLFQLEKGPMETLIRKVLRKHPEVKDMHCKRIMVIQVRKSAKSNIESEWLVAIKHYDLYVIQLLQAYRTSESVDAFIRDLKQ